jgi:hypothetical protein
LSLLLGLHGKKKHKNDVTSPQTSFPPVPEDTFQAATALYGKGNIYLKLGDHLEQLLDGLLSADTDTWGKANRSLETHIHQALLTIFQYVEELTNEQILDAVRNRLDLRYALHLPLKAPGVSLKALCKYHQDLVSNPAHQHILQSLLDQMAESGFLGLSTGHPLSARQVLATICIVSQFDEVTKAMYQALEALAVVDPEWLRQVTRPYWYDRYNRSSRLAAISFFDPKWNSRALEIVGDIQYLLETIDALHNPVLASLPEIQRIRQSLGEHFLMCLNEPDQKISFERMVTECNGCSLLSHTQEM